MRPFGFQTFLVLCFIFIDPTLAKYSYCVLLLLLFTKQTQTSVLLLSSVMAASISDSDSDRSVASVSSDDEGHNTPNEAISPLQVPSAAGKFKPARNIRKKKEKSQVKERSKVWNRLEFRS